MKSSTRFLLGVVSTLLLATGFARAADRLDTVDHQPVVSTDELGQRATLPCSLPCDLPDEYLK